MSNDIQSYTGDRQSTTSLVLDTESMKSIMSVASVMAKGTATIPKHLQKNEADCMAVVMQAMQWKMNPFVVAQKTHVSQSGVLGYEAQLISAVAVGSGALKTQPDFEFIGDWSKILGKVKEMKSDKGGKYYVQNWNPSDENGLGVICTATLAGEGVPRSITVLLSQCFPRFSTQWATDPQQQISYAAVRKFCRRFAPGAILGVYTPDELAEIDITSSSGAATSAPGDEGEGEIDYLDESQVENLREAINKSGATEEAFCKHARIGCIDDLQPARYDAAMASLKQKAEKLKAAQQAQEGAQGGSEQ